MKKVILFCVFALLMLKGIGQFNDKKIVPAAERADLYLPLLKGKRIGIFANQTSMAGSMHLVDRLKKEGVDISVIFGPEHGFRGTADAGEKVGNYVDAESGIPVVSLYGSKRKPSSEDVKGVDLLLFDIQDVGVRFYTYISSLQEYMEAAIELGKPLIIFDRPNPNGHYVDGPVLEKRFQSFVGMQAVPVVYGLTIGEYAHMLMGEKWLSKEAIDQLSKKAKHWPVASQTNNGVVQIGDFLTIVPCANYSHQSTYVLPVRPSPNLPSIQSILLYPSTCFFEGTVLSEGRGTDKPFQVFGHPSLPTNLFSFTPRPNEGAKKSKHYGQVCYGWDLSGTPEETRRKVDNKIQLKWLIDAYRLFPDKENFFILPKSGKMEESFFNKLAGNDQLWRQIRDGLPESDIRQSWEPALSHYKSIRKKYLLYAD